MMLLEITAHRIGGYDGPRQFGPTIRELSRTAIETPALDARDDTRAWITAMFADWADVDDDWISCRVTLNHMDGQFIGIRPVLIFRRPYDVPTYALFRPAWTEAGTFSLGLRMLAAS